MLVVRFTYQVGRDSAALPCLARQIAQIVQPVCDFVFVLPLPVVRSVHYEHGGPVREFFFRNFSTSPLVQCILYMMSFDSHSRLWGSQMLRESSSFTVKIKLHCATYTLTQLLERDL